MKGTKTNLCNCPVEKNLRGNVSRFGSICNVAHKKEALPRKICHEAHDERCGTASHASSFWRLHWQRFVYAIFDFATNVFVFNISRWISEGRAGCETFASMAAGDDDTHADGTCSSPQIPSSATRIRAVSSQPCHAWWKVHELNP